VYNFPTRKLFSTVTAFLALVFLLAPAVQSQGPAGTKGPDAATATLVNTVCASCDALDRVNNKKADSNGWTTTVTRMKEAGANLTDEQVPLVVDYLTRNAGALAPLHDLAKGKSGGRVGLVRLRVRVVGEVAMARTSKCSREPTSRPLCRPSCRR